MCPEIFAIGSDFQAHAKETNTDLKTAEEALKGRLVEAVQSKN